MGYMLLSHGYGYIVNNGRQVFDVTGPQMWLTIRLTASAFQVADGISFVAPPRNERVLKIRQRQAIAHVPSPLEYFSFCFCFTTVLAGPSFDFVEFRRGTSTITTTSTSSREWMWKGIALFGESMVYMMFQMVILRKFPLGAVLDADFVNHHSMISRLAYVHVAVFGLRCMFYFAWKIAESACTFAGFGADSFENSYGSSGQWNGVENADVIGFETSCNMQGITRRWNKTTQNWLEHSIYRRSGKSLVVTYVICGLWHGWQPCYLVFFLSLALLSLIERLVQQKINPLVLPEGMSDERTRTRRTLYDVVSWLCTNIVIAHVMAYFFLGSWSSCVQYYHLYNPSGHALLLLVLAVLYVLPKPKKHAAAKSE